MLSLIFKFLIVCLLVLASTFNFSEPVQAATTDSLLAAKQPSTTVSTKPKKKATDVTTNICGWTPRGWRC